MIELPRAALMAGEIAESAEFFSFGTNDLTQTTFGISRDDAASFLGIYTARGILPGDPFVSIDREGVGELVRIGVERGRKVRKDLKVGICGEHGGDPASVAFCHEVGLDYVSCSPFRVPIARLAAAQAALGKKAGGRKLEEHARRGSSMRYADVTIEVIVARARADHRPAAIACTRSRDYDAVAEGLAGGADIARCARSRAGSAKAPGR